MKTWLVTVGKIEIGKEMAVTIVEAESQRDAAQIVMDDWGQETNKTLEEVNVVIVDTYRPVTFKPRLRFEWVAEVVANEKAEVMLDRKVVTTVKKVNAIAPSKAVHTAVNTGMKRYMLIKQLLDALENGSEWELARRLQERFCCTEDELESAFWWASARGCAESRLSAKQGYFPRLLYKITQKGSEMIRDWKPCNSIDLTTAIALSFPDEFVYKPRRKSTHHRRVLPNKVAAIMGVNELTAFGGCAMLERSGQLVFGKNSQWSTTSKFFEAMQEKR